jgi:hypothetical protein
MYRALEILSGIGVLLVCLQDLAALFQSTQRVPPIPLIYLAIYATILFFSFVGAFILLSWAKKPK